MKKNILIIIFFAACTMVMFSCKSNKSVNMPSERETAANTNMEEREDSQSANGTNANETSAKEATESEEVGGVVTQTGGSTGAAGSAQMPTSGQSTASTKDYDTMYSQLQMTEEQIQQFNMGMKEFSESVAKDPNGAMRGTIESEQDRQLGAILTDEQLRAYEDWKKNN